MTTDRDPRFPDVEDKSSRVCREKNTRYWETFMAMLQRQHDNGKSK